MKKVKTYAIFALLIVVIGFLLWDGCQSRRQARDFETQMSEFESKEQSFRRIIDKQGREIAEQNQIILTKDQAIAQGLIANTKLKNIKSQVRVITSTRLDTIFIPFNEPDVFDPDIFDDVNNVISVPKPFLAFNKWYWIEGRIVKRGLEIDTIQFFNTQTVTIGNKRLKGLRNIFKRKIPTVEIINESPYVSVQGLQNVVIKRKRKKFWQTTAFKVGVGFGLGIYTAVKLIK